MEKFTKLTAIAAPLPIINCDTDKIIPARFLKTIHRSGLGEFVFDALRYNEDRTENPDFVLNRAPYRQAEILVAGENFGCGSSREHAPWALADFGIRCVISSGFADIFYNNSFKNGMLLITLPQAEVDKLMQDAEMGENARLTVDLEEMKIIRPDGSEIAFELDPFKRYCLLNGLDEIGLTLTKDAAISDYEARRQIEQPWLGG